MSAAVSPPPSARHFASTAPSSIAMPAPCATNGSIACAASPSSAMLPLDHWPLLATVNSAHLRQLSTVPTIIRAGLGHLACTKAFLTSNVSPVALQPGLFHVPGGP